MVWRLVPSVEDEYVLTFASGDAAHGGGLSLVSTSSLRCKRADFAVNASIRLSPEAAHEQPCSAADGQRWPLHIYTRQTALAACDISCNIAALKLHVESKTVSHEPTTSWAVTHAHACVHVTWIVLFSPLTCDVKMAVGLSFQNSYSNHSLLQFPACASYRKLVLAMLRARRVRFRWCSVADQAARHITMCVYDVEYVIDFNDDRSRINSTGACWNILAEALLRTRKKSSPVMPRFQQPSQDSVLLAS
jgi:hypothetical protein